MKFYTKLLGILSLLTALLALTILSFSLFNESITKINFSLGLLGIYFTIHFAILNRFGFKETDISAKNIRGLLFTSSILFIILSIGVLIPLVQEHNQKSKIEILSKLKDYGKDENISTGTIGTLKTKFENDKLYYQVTLDIPKKQLDSIADFSIQLLDIDGFIISDFNLLTSDNIITSDNGNTLQATINDNLKFSVLNYQKIAKWELLGKRK
ncbi:MAG: hypothetical protein WCP69_13590 [Bacteroidota bacterium]